MEQQNSGAMDGNTSISRPGRTPDAVPVLAGAVFFLPESLILFIENLLSYLNVYGYIAGDTTASIEILGVEAFIGILLLAISLYESMRPSGTRIGQAYISLLLAVISPLLYGALPFFGSNGTPSGYFASIEFMLVHAPLISLGLILVIFGSVRAIIRHRKRSAETGE